MNRREFISGIVAAGAAGGLSAAEGSPTIGAAAGQPLKVCVFSDIHYERGFWTNADDPTFLEKILARAERESCDMMIQCGDFMHGVTKPWQKEFVKLYNEFKIPGYHVLGNHDQEQNSAKETCDAYRIATSGHYSFDKGGFRFVIADPNYFCPEPGKYVHYERSNYAHAHGATTNVIPPDEMEWMRATIVGSPLPCIVFSHQSIERGNCDPVANSGAVRSIFNEANAKKPGTVRLVVNGHAHNDNLRVLDNVLYWDVNSANYQWFGPKHAKYPAEYMKSHPGAQYTLAWTEPLSGVLTLWQDGRIRIEGSKADWLFGVKPTDANYPKYDRDGRETHPVIQSADMTFHFG
jgi:hypothetical protein